MAVFTPSMSAIPYLQNHMTGAHGHSATPGLPNLITQSSNKKPKLSLQTTSLTGAYGALSRGTGPNPAQATFTPTTTNTLANTWDLSIRPSPISRTESPKHQSIRPRATQQPYSISLPYGIRPILKNSPLPPRQGSVSASPGDSKRKVFFPQPKRVVFKQNLEDFIVTKDYVARHIDLTSSEEESSSDQEQPDAPPPDVQSHDPTGPNFSPPPSRKRKNRRDSGIHIETNVQELPTASSQELQSTKACKDKKRRRSRWSTGSEDTASSETRVNQDDAHGDLAVDEPEDNNDSVTSKEIEGTQPTGSRSESSSGRTIQTMVDSGPEQKDYGDPEAT